MGKVSIWNMYNNGSLWGLEEVNLSLIKLISCDTQTSTASSRQTTSITFPSSQKEKKKFPSWDN